MDPVWQNAVQRTVRTVHIIVHNCRSQHSTGQFWLSSLLTSRHASQLRLSSGGEEEGGGVRNQVSNKFDLMEFGLYYALQHIQHIISKRLFILHLSCPLKLNSVKTMMTFTPSSKDPYTWMLVHGTCWKKRNRKIWTWSTNLLQKPLFTIQSLVMLTSTHFHIDTSPVTMWQFRGMWKLNKEFW